MYIANQKKSSKKSKIELRFIFLSDIFLTKLYNKLIAENVSSATSVWAPKVFQIHIAASEAVGICLFLLECQRFLLNYRNC